MTTWRERADEALTHNVADVFEHGPRLAWSRKTAEIAIDRPNRRVLVTGLGAMGVGTMWFDYKDEKPEWADLPEQDSAAGFGDAWRSVFGIPGTNPTARRTTHS